MSMSKNAAENATVREVPETPDAPVPGAAAHSEPMGGQDREQMRQEEPKKRPSDSPEKIQPRPKTMAIKTAKSVAPRGTVDASLKLKPSMSSVARPAALAGQNDRVMVRKTAFHGDIRTVVNRIPNSTASQKPSEPQATCDGNMSKMSRDVPPSIKKPHHTAVIDVNKPTPSTIGRQQLLSAREPSGDKIHDPTSRSSTEHNQRSPVAPYFIADLESTSSEEDMPLSTRSGKIFGRDTVETGAASSNTASENGESKQKMPSRKTPSSNVPPRKSPPKSPAIKRKPANPKDPLKRRAPALLGLNPSEVAADLATFEQGQRELSRPPTATEANDTESSARSKKRALSIDLSDNSDSGSRSGTRRKRHKPDGNTAGHEPVRANSQNLLAANETTNRVEQPRSKDTKPQASAGAESVSLEGLSTTLSEEAEETATRMPPPAAADTAAAALSESATCKSLQAEMPISPLIGTEPATSEVSGSSASLSVPMEKVGIRRCVIKALENAPAQTASCRWIIEYISVNFADHPYFMSHPNWRHSVSPILSMHNEFERTNESDEPYSKQRLYKLNLAKRKRTGSSDRSHRSRQAKRRPQVLQSTEGPPEIDSTALASPPLKESMPMGGTTDDPANGTPQVEADNNRPDVVADNGTAHISVNGKAPVVADEGSDEDDSAALDKPTIGTSDPYAMKNPNNLPMPKFKTDQNPPEEYEKILATFSRMREEQEEFCRDLFAAHPELHPDEEMFDVEAKIEEIKRRPKRKETLGSLKSSARKYRIKRAQVFGTKLFDEYKPTGFDPSAFGFKTVSDHEESDNDDEPAANCTKHVNGNNKEGDSNGESDEGDGSGKQWIEHSSFEEMLSGPKNLIPACVDGQLVFRDESWNRGKLRRARDIYKVGYKNT
ncbi:hypothetical protein BDY21DRAFT_87898 [Lineolata rhizophorae]|uniref:Uncharacterized protein n=1 Tax=Lineolata rhizophorae TaxID=578093 RepID=A0A6A6PC39_9PEZI|nr:hypothetical protein BDY21DRAFT_87898 [Lineolata rhizophorae]